MASNLSLTDYISTLPATTPKIRYNVESQTILRDSIIYEYPSMKLLGVLPRKPVARTIKMSELDNFTMYEAIDGTIVTIYKQAGQWKVASYNNPDISNYTRFSTITFLGAIRETLSSYPKFNWERLSDQVCYTICFSHPGFHPLQTRASCYFIQACDLRGLTWVEGMTAESITTSRPSIGLPEQPIISDRKKQCIVSCKTSLDDYLRGKRPVYGYILKNAEETVLIESRLMKTIRQLVYNIPKGKSTGIDDLELYVTLKAYLSINSRLFITLFPQYKKRYETYAAFINKLADELIFDQKLMDEGVVKSSLCILFADQIRACGIKLVASNRAIVVDYLQNVINLMVFYKELTNNSMSK